jgi:predicted N-acetyltransferase YhbS
MTNAVVQFNDMPQKVLVRPALAADSTDISQLHARTFGPGRFARTAYRVREARPGFSRFCRVCVIDGRIAAAVQFTPITIGGKGRALLLGPLAVDPAFANRGHGRGIAGEGMEAARHAGVELVVLVGDESYYARLGFRRVPPSQITMPGPVDPMRLLAAELVTGSLASYFGVVVADTSA